MTRRRRLVLLAWTASAVWATVLAGGCHTSLRLDNRMGGRLGDELREAIGPDSPAGNPAAAPADGFRSSAGLQAETAERPIHDPVAPPTGSTSQLLREAAAFYERGEDEQAIAQLEAYVAQRPEHLIARAQLAELLFRHKRWDEARLHFELFIAQAQDHEDLAFRYLIHSHSRLVEIAEGEEDEYEERLNRGIGLYLLACRRTGEADASAAPTPNALFCKAATQLQQARRCAREESRPNWYLYRVWSRLGQQSAARRALDAADAQALLSRLTPPERRQLHAACLSDER